MRVDGKIGVSGYFDFKRNKIRKEKDLVLGFSEKPSRAKKRCSLQRSGPNRRGRY